MSYPGNPSLSAEVQRRILGTFNQSLDLAAAGRRQEASLGCEFILQLDPAFGAAGVLRDRLAAGDGAVFVEDLRGGQLPAPPAATPSSFATMQMQIPPLGPPPGPPVAEELERLFAEREFTAILSRLQATPALLDQPGVREIAARAQDRFEAQPYVQTYLESAQKALQAGSGQEVHAILEKARALDPTHPQIPELLQRAGAAAPPMDRELPDLAGEGEPEPVEDYELEIPEDEWNLEVAEAEPLAALAADEPFAPLIPPDAPVAFAPPPPAGPPSLDFPSFDSLPELGAVPSFGDPSPWAPPAPVETPAPAPPIVLPSFAEPALPPPTDFPSFAAPTPAFTPPPSFDLGNAAPTDERITALLEEGDGALRRGDLQAAIDAWSRIFLIDVDHAEAAQRIEGARRQKAEKERQVEEIFHEGLAEFERGNIDDARSRFQRVLTLQPGHLAAREALERLEHGSSANLSPLDLGLGDSAGGLDALAGLGAAAADLREEILVPPPPGAGSGSASSVDGKKGASLENFRMVAVKKETPKRTFALIGGAVFLLVLAAGWLLARNWSKIFPNSNDEAVEVVKAEAIDPIEQAERLFKEGKEENALAYLKRVRPDHPKFATAQSMIATWEKAAEEKAAAEAGAAVEQQQDRWLQAAHSAEDSGERLLAALLYERASKVGPLAPEEQTRREQVDLALRPLKEEILLFRDREYDLLLPRLWRKREADPANRDVQRMLVDSYHNLGVKALQQSDPRKALAQFDQALEITAGDAEIQRLRRFAESYNGRKTDLLYRTFVKYVPQR